MTNIASVLKSEISRIARKEVRAEIDSLKKVASSTAVLLRSCDVKWLISKSKSRERAVLRPLKLERPRALLRIRHGASAQLAWRRIAVSSGCRLLPMGSLSA